MDKKCSECKDIVESGYAMCRRCRLRTNERASKRRRAARAAGLCGTCYTRQAPWQRSTCDGCLRYRNKYRRTEKFRAVARRLAKGYYQRWPEKLAAQNALRAAVKVGKVIKQPCVACGDYRVEAHHRAGYAKENWLNVEWLCHAHHTKAHLLGV